MTSTAPQPKTSQPKTLRTLAGLPTAPPSFSASALVIIDAQGDYGPGGVLALPGYESAVGQIVELLRAARSRDVPIVHILHQGTPGGLFDPALGGRMSSEIAAEVVSGPKELTIEKTLPNSFASTALHEVLSDFGTTDLVLAGFMTHMCVSSTARAALDLGYSSTVVSDAAATRDLPGVAGRPAVDAQTLHFAALAGLADRFSVVASTAEVLSQ